MLTKYIIIYFQPFLNDFIKAGRSEFESMSFNRLALDYNSPNV